MPNQRFLSRSSYMETKLSFEVWPAFRYSTVRRSSWPNCMLHECPLRIDIGDERLANGYRGFPRLNLEVPPVVRLDPDDAVVFVRNRLNRGRCNMRRESVMEELPFGEAVYAGVVRSPESLVIPEEDVVLKLELRGGDIGKPSFVLLPLFNSVSVENPDAAGIVAGHPSDRLLRNSLGCSHALKCAVAIESEVTTLTAQPKIAGRITV